jgi:hypothetical protein
MNTANTQVADVSDLARAWIAHRQLRSTDRNGTLAVALRDDARTVTAELLLVPSESPVRGLTAVVRSPRRISRDGWTRALWACNEWNRIAAVPRARLATPDSGGETASVVLDAWLPVPVGAPAQLVEDFADAVLHGALRFWRPRPGAEESVEP